MSWLLHHGAWYKKKMIMLMINIDKERKFFEENGLMRLKVCETKKKKWFFFNIRALHRVRVQVEVLDYITSGLSLSIHWSFNQQPTWTSLLNQLGLDRKTNLTWPESHPSRYFAGLTLLDFSVRTGTAAFNGNIKRLAKKNFYFSNFLLYHTHGFITLLRL